MNRRDSERVDAMLSMAALGFGKGLAGALGSQSESHDGDVELGEDDDANEKDVGEVYADRNLLVLAFARHFAEKHGRDRIGWYEHDEWAVVTVKLAPGVPVSWHVRPEVIPSGMPERDPEDWYDGHSREEKNDRLAGYVYDQPEDAAIWGWWK